MLGKARKWPIPKSSLLISIGQILRTWLHVTASPESKARIFVSPESLPHSQAQLPRGWAAKAGQTHATG